MILMMNKMKRIAVFASGNGTNCENIIRYFSTSVCARVAVVITNNCKAKVIERAEKLDIPVVVMPRADINNENKITKVMHEYEIDFIVLAGFMLFVPDFLIEAYKNRIVNIHPSLLPKYGGKGMYGILVHEAVKNNNERESGITIHLVNNEYDKGEIVAQFSTAIDSNDTVDEIASKVHSLEYEYYPKVIENLLKEE